MRLNRLVLDGFMSYEHADLDFTGVSQVVAVGPVGAGKSSLIEALRWALWGEVRVSVLDSVVRDGADLATVRVEFSSGGHDVAVTRTKGRGRDSTLTLEVDGEARTRHTLRETMAEVRLIVGLGHDAALAGPLMLQGDAGALMRLSPASRKEVLLGLFGLERFEALEVAAKEKRDDAQLTARSALNMIAALGSPITDMTLHQATLTDLRPKAETLGEAVAFGRARVSELTTSTATLRERVGRAMAVQKELDEVRADFKAKREQMNLAAAAALAAVNALGALRDEEPAAKPTDEQAAQAEQMARDATKVHAAAYAALDAHRKALVALDKQPEVTCPHCGKVFRPDVAEGAVESARQAVIDAEADEEMERQNRETALEHVDLIRSVRQKVADWEKNSTAAESHLLVMKARVAGLAPQVKDLSVRGNTLKAELAGLEASGPELTSLLEELDSARIALDANEANVALVEADIVRVTSLIEHAKAAIERRDFLEKERAEAAEKASMYAILASAFHRNGIPTLMLESGLPTIEARTNDVLDRMPGGFKVRLSTQRATQAGRMQERLDVVVEIDGHEREYAALSGGQQFRVDLALRMGLTAALSNRTFETLIIDEGLDRFQDAPGREALLESLSAVAEDFGLVLVCSHHPEVVERFGSRVEITMSDGVSSAVLS